MDQICILNPVSHLIDVVDGIVVAFAGAYDPSATYNMGQSASYTDNHLYISLKDGNQGNEPDISPAWWAQISAVPQGPTGWTGYTGPGNFTGYTGYTGMAGTPGGPTGPTGGTGYTGPSGGPQGATGYSGYTGPQGPGGTGYTGYTGYTGTGNFTGFTGYTGAFSVGPAGPTGWTGYTGLGNYTGNTGYTGYTGSLGPIGNAGQTGYSGYTGYTGYTGGSTNTGPTGYTGYTGYTGPAVSLPGNIMRTAAGTPARRWALKVADGNVMGSPPTLAYDRISDMDVPVFGGTAADSWYQDAVTCENYHTYRSNAVDDYAGASGAPTLMGKNINFICRLGLGTFSGNLTEIRVWLGLTSDTLSSILQSDAPASVDILAFRWSPNTASDTSWKIVTRAAGGGGNIHQFSTGVTPTSLGDGTQWAFQIKCDDAHGVVYFYIDGVDVYPGGVSTYLPISGELLYPFVGLQGLNGGSEDIRHFFTYVERDC